MVGDGGGGVSEGGGGVNRTHDWLLACQRC